MKIITNSVPRALVSYFDLPEKVRTDFDYVAEEDYYSPRFVSYKDNWYDTYDTERIGVFSSSTKPAGYAMYVAADHPFSNWDGVVIETYFSGVLFRFVDEYERVVVGRYFS